MKRNHKGHKGSAGFTLIEMIVVIFIVGVGLVGIMSFFNISLDTQFETKNEIIAANLAREGTEIIRNLRDYNILNGNNWDQGLNSSCKAVDYNSLSSHNCYNLSQRFVCRNSQSRYYQKNCTESSPNFAGFKRRIIIGNVAGDGSRTVTCNVTWDDDEKTTSAVDVLYPNEF